jgi:hypothetical protein
MPRNTAINDFARNLFSRKRNEIWPQVTRCLSKLKQDQPGMMLLIRLMVKYECSTDAILPFMMKNDRRRWKTFFAGFNFELFICHQEGHIFLLIRDCADQKKMQEALTNLPLVKEGFFEITVYQFIGFENLDSFFGPAMEQ